MGFKDTKITLCTFEPYECNAVKEYLEMMAEKGWMLQSISMNFFKFKKIEPRKISYSVNPLEKASIFDTTDTDEALEYRRIYEDDGWRFIDQANKVQIFMSEYEWKTTPIHKEPEELFKSISKASSHYVFSQLAIVILFMINIYLQFFSRSLDYSLSSNLSIATGILLGSIVLANFIEGVSFFCWYLKTKRKIKENEFKHYGSYKQLRIKNSIILLGIVLNVITLIVCMILGDGITIVDLLLILIPVIVMVITYKLIGKLKISIEFNILMTTAITIISLVIVADIVASPMFNDYDLKDNKLAYGINLTLMDFGVDKEDEDHTYKDTQSSVLAKRIEYNSTYDNNSLDYTILESEYPWVIELQKNSFIRKYIEYGSHNMIEKDMNLPNNIKVYSADDTQKYIITSENKVIEIANWLEDVSEDEFINKVYKKLFE
ncbi:DUF2812 domain-containing protein [Clostridium sardiniense]|uniref:DUF2812 domain-containing protein n=1 Tax=Clostridium sardiniense TaxID=29369 RepID=UPI003D35803D